MKKIFLYVMIIALMLGAASSIGIVNAKERETLMADTFGMPNDTHYAYFNKPQIITASATAVFVVDELSTKVLRLYGFNQAGEPTIQCDLNKPPKKLTAAGDTLIILNADNTLTYYVVGGDKEPMPLTLVQQNKKFEIVDIECKGDKLTVLANIVTPDDFEVAGVFYAVPLANIEVETLSARVSLKDSVLGQTNKSPSQFTQIAGMIYYVEEYIVYTYAKADTNKYESHELFRVTEPIYSLTSGMGAVETGNGNQGALFISTERGIFAYNQQGEILDFQGIRETSFFEQYTFGARPIIAYGKDRLYILDIVGKAVTSLVLDANLKFVPGGQQFYSIAKSGYHSPVDICSYNNKTYILDSGNQVVQIYDDKGASEKALPGGEYFRICMDESAKLYVATRSKLFCLTNSVDKAIADIRDIAPIAGGGLYILHGNQISAYKNGEMTNIFEEDFSDVIRIATNLKDGTLYTLAKNKVIAYSSDTQQVLFERELGIQDAVDLDVDYKGSLFIITPQEVLRLSKDELTSFTLHLPTDNFIEARLSGVCLDTRTGNLLLVDSQAASIASLDKVELGVKTPFDSPDWTPKTDIFTHAELKLLGFAKITGYYSTILYTPQLEVHMLNIGDTLTVVEGILDEYAYVVCGHITGIVLTRYLEMLPEQSTALSDRDMRIMLNNTELYNLPSPLIQENKSAFRLDSFSAHTPVTVLSEIGCLGAEGQDIVWLKVRIGDQTGYLPRFAVSEYTEIWRDDFKYVTLSGTFSSGIVLYEQSNTHSAALLTLPSGVSARFLGTENGFTHIRITYKDKIYTGYVENQFVIPSGLTPMQKIGFVLLFSLIPLGVITIILRSNRIHL